MSEFNQEQIQEAIDKGRKAVVECVRQHVADLPEAVRSHVAWHIFNTSRVDSDFLHGIPDAIRRQAQAQGLQHEANALSQAMAHPQPGRGW